YRRILEIVEVLEVLEITEVLEILEIAEILEVLEVAEVLEIEPRDLVGIGLIPRYSAGVRKRIQFTEELLRPAQPRSEVGRLLPGLRCVGGLRKRHGNQKTE